MATNFDIPQFGTGVTPGINSTRMQSIWTFLKAIASGGAGSVVKADLALDSNTLGGKSLANFKDVSTAGLVGHWRGDAPEYPDDPAGVTYFNNNFSAADGWTATNCTLSYVNGKMRMTATGANPKIARAVTASRDVRVKIQKISGGGVASRIMNTTGTLYTNDKTYTDIINPHIHDFLIGAGATGNVEIYGATTGSGSGDVYEITFAYIGTGAYLPNSLLDLSGNANHGTIYGATPVETPYGRGLSFDGFNDYWRTENNFALTTEMDFSLYVWLYIPTAHVWNTSAIMILFGLGSSPGAIGILGNTTNNQIRAGFRDDTASRTTDNYTITRDTWHNFIMSYSKNTRQASFHANGQYIGITSVGDANYAFDVDFLQCGFNRLLGGSSPTFTMLRCAQPRIYNRALSAEEVWSLYQNPLQGADGLVKSFSPAPLSLVVRGPNGGMSMRITALNPKDGTAGNRPRASFLGEIVYYSGKLYFCTNITTPTWEAITSS